LYNLFKSVEGKNLVAPAESSAQEIGKKRRRNIIEKLDTKTDGNSEKRVEGYAAAHQIRLKYFESLVI